jgi:hypothetical protein
MKTKALWIACLLLCGRAHAVLIDFDDIPNGTLVSANTYGGILNIRAEAGRIEEVFKDGQFTFQQVWSESSIRNGVIEVVNEPSFAPFFYARFTATFSQPVTDVSFSIFAWRHGGYSYNAVNVNGDVVTRSGATGSTGLALNEDFIHYDLEIPDGYYLTDFSLGNQDPKFLDAGIWIDNIAFTVREAMEPVPEVGKTATLLAAGCAVLFAFSAFGTRRSPIFLREG